MGFPLQLARRYLSARQRASISVGTALTIIGVMLGVAALTTVISVTGGFRSEFRRKVLGVNAHVLVLKYASEFREYREVMEVARATPGVTAVAPFVINPMMVTKGERTATGVLLKGIDPTLTPKVLDLPQHISEPKGMGAEGLSKLRLPGAKAPHRREDEDLSPPPAAAATGSGGVLDDIDRLLKKGGLGDDEPRDDALPSDAPRGSTVPDGGWGSKLPDDDLGDLPDFDDAGTLADLDKPVKPPAPAAAPSAAPAASDHPAGPVTPSGGYQSGELPDDIIDLPPDVDPDPCANPEAVAELPGIIIGSTLGRQLEATLGDCVQVTSPTIGYSFNSKGELRAPVAKQFRVIALFDSGFDQYDSKLVYTDLYEAQDFAGSGDSVTGIEMRVDDINRAGAIAKELDARLGKKLSSRLYHTMDWKELNHGLFTALLIQQLMMTMVLGLIVLVAAFTVIATLVMVVLDKKREIAVLKAMGATDFAVLKAFTYQGLFIGLVGTALGLLLGYGLCNGLLVYGFPLDPKVYFISRLPVQVRVLDFALVGVFALVVCLLSAIGPALYAALLRPAQAFRES